MRLILRVWKYSSIGLHFIGTVLYGITLIYLECQNDRTDPRSTYVGDFKYLTYWNLIFQFVFNILSLWADLRPKAKYTKKLRKFCDKFFFCVSFPFSMFVCLSFWTLNSLDNSSVRNPNVSNRFPEWYNHVTHTINGVLNGLELIITYHSYPGHKHGIFVTVVLYTAYTTFMYMLGKFSNIWIYPFLEKMYWSKRIIFAVIGGIKLLTYFIASVCIHNYIWPTNRINRFRHIMS